jgi:hypothetical protein
MPNVYKSDAVEILDDFFSGDRGSGDLSRTYERVLTLLESDDGLAEITRRFIARDHLLTEHDLEHFVDHWLASDPDIDRVMKERYRQAISEALDEQGAMPIDTYWIGDAADDFEMHVLKGKRRVAVHVFIPRGFDPLQGK